jgi:N-acetylmuramoyl-L-alanine amidase
LNWINRYIVPIGSAALAMLLGGALPVLADTAITASYGAQTIHFTHVSQASSGAAVGTADPGLAQLLKLEDATLTWKPGERYVMITTGVPLVVSFAVGDRRYDVGAISLQASFAPFQQGDEVYLPFDEVLRSLGLALRQDATGTVLQPQLSSLDVQNTGNRVTVVAHGGAPLRPRIVSESAGAVVYEFAGVGTTLAGTRAVNAGGVRNIAIAQTGTLRDPKTVVTVQLMPGASHEAPRSNDDRDVVLGFGGSGAPAPMVETPAVAQAAPAEPTPVPGEATPVPGPPGVQTEQPEGLVTPAAAGPALVSAVQVQPTSDGVTVTVVVTGNAAFEWHRLRDPDNRFWIDIKNAQLQAPPIDEMEPAPLGSVRARQVDPSTVRIALSLTGSNRLDISPTATGLIVTVGRDEVADAPRTGSGSVGSVVSVGEQSALVTPAPLGESGSSDGSPWKFGGGGSTYVPTNPRLIVIDPGHGGSDIGAVRNGLSEATVNLDTAKRLRAILIARGWQVQMTRETDVDVYAPNDTAHQELQARDDVANNAGARLLVSLHANSFINSGPYGTTIYISKPSDAALAKIVEHYLSADLGTKDDGIVKSHLYITLHSLMPAVLVETAFLSNPDDFALLSSPAWRQKVAQAIADGIDQYAQEYPVKNQPGQ